MRFSKTLSVSVILSVMLAHGAYAAPVTVDFEDAAPGTIITEIGGLTITSNITGFNLFVATGFETTSGVNYLGVDDGGSESFLGGDEIYFSFAAPVNFFSLTAITTPFLPSGALTLSHDGVTATSGAPDSVLSLGDEVFTLSIFDAAGFTDITLSAAFGVFAFNIDDIVFEAVDAEIPLPGALVLFLTGLFGLASRRRISATVCKF